MNVEEDQGPELTRGHKHIVDVWRGILSFDEVAFRPYDLHVLLNKEKYVASSVVFKEVKWNKVLGTIAVVFSTSHEHYYQITDAPEWEDIIAEIEDFDRLYPSGPAEPTDGL